MNKRQERTLEGVKRMFGCYNQIIEVETEDLSFTDDILVTIVTRPEHLTSDLFDSCYIFSIGSRGGIYRYTDSHRREYIQQYELYTKCSIW